MIYIWASNILLKGSLFDLFSTFVIFFCVNTF